MASLKVALDDAPAAIPAGAAETSRVIEDGAGHKAWLFAPGDASAAGAAGAGPLPLLVVMHGAGKDKMWSLEESVGAWAERAQAHGILVLYPAARGSTWDYISSGRRERRDFDFVERAVNTVRKTYRVDDGRIALLGLSDGGSMALSLASHNPGVFQAAMSVSAGFCASPPRISAASPAPKLFIKHGAADSMFPLRRVGLPLRDKLIELGYDVEHRVGEGEGGMFGPAGHVPPGWQEEFLPSWLALPAATSAKGSL